MRTGWSGVVAALVAAAVLAGGAALEAGEPWTSWSAEHAERIGRAANVRGRVGGFFDTRFLKTERSYNYKLAATWLTPEVIRASARLLQIRQRLSEQEAVRLVDQAEAAAPTAVLVEIDPREGSGVIPLDWVAILQFGAGVEIRGTLTPALRDVPSLAGVLRRNYDYDRFWVTFPLLDERGQSLVPAGTGNAVLKVRIYDHEGRVEWPMSPMVFERARQLAAERPGDGRSSRTVP